MSTTSQLLSPSPSPSNPVGNSDARTRARVQRELDSARWASDCYDPFFETDALGGSTWPYALAAAGVSLLAFAAALGCGGAL